MIDIKRFFGRMEEEFRRAHPSIPASDFSKIWNGVRTRVEEEAPPRVAVMGNSGVGKTTTLNALFNAGLPVSHVTACTRTPTELRVGGEDVAFKRGLLTVYDMPGLGESIVTQRSHLEHYNSILARVDVAIWILDANNRAVGDFQTYVRRLEHLPEKLVVALNKVDMLHPGDWHPQANLPSESQLANIQSRVEDVAKRMKEVLPGWKGPIEHYSATKRYRLPLLFETMLNAVKKDRQWVLGARAEFADFLALVDKRLLESISEAGISHDRNDTRRSASPTTVASVQQVPALGSGDAEAGGSTSEIDEWIDVDVDLDESHVVPPAGVPTKNRMPTDAAGKLEARVAQLSEDEFRKIAADRETFMQFLRAQGSKPSTEPQSNLQNAARPEDETRKEPKE